MMALEERLLALEDAVNQATSSSLACEFIIEEILVIGADGGPNPSATLNALVDRINQRIDHMEKKPTGERTAARLRLVVDQVFSRAQARIRPKR